ncbi:MAG: hypothetical protein D3909_02935 [Candidatus Electrothrix sp. ATG1]|nr:hypothetical protein [Candidatus Electrothrix sp. ATG1]
MQPLLSCRPVISRKNEVSSSGRSSSTGLRKMICSNSWTKGKTRLSSGRIFGKIYARSTDIMQTFQEKFTLVLTAAVYLLFHLRLGSSAASIITGTAAQLLTTAPYSIGFTWILVIIIRFLHADKRPAWDRIARIFFTIGILFAFYFALYERNERVLEEQGKQEQVQSTLSPNQSE